MAIQQVYVGIVDKNEDRDNSAATHEGDAVGPAHLRKDLLHIREKHKKLLLRDIMSSAYHKAGARGKAKRAGSFEKMPLR